MQLKDVVFVVSNKQIYCDVAGVKTHSTVPKSVRRNTGRKGIKRCAKQLALRVTESESSNYSAASKVFAKKQNGGCCKKQSSRKNNAEIEKLIG